MSTRQFSTRRSGGVAPISIVHCGIGISLSLGHQRSLLAYFMTEPGACDKFLQRISPSIFTAPNDKIVEAIFDLHNEHEKVNLVTVSNRLDRKHVLAECGGRSGITDISIETTSEEIAESALDSILDNYRAQQAARIGEQMHKYEITLTDALDSLTKLNETCNGHLPPPTSIIALAETNAADFEIDNFLGNRFLCKEGGMLMVAPSGIGKSSAGVQQDVCWALGRPAFGIKPSRPLRILTIQAENDDGDLAEMVRGVCDHLNLDDEQRRLVAERVVYIKEKALTGDAFLYLLRRLVRKYKPDIIRIDPLHAYAGGDVRDPAVTTAFLRNGLNPILAEFHCAAVICHHTPKTTYRDTNEWNATDWMYAGAGNADITNWARAILVIDATPVHGAFVFRAAKRGSRIGWAADDGHPVYDRLFCHQTGGGIFWRDGTDEDREQVALAKRGKPSKTKQEFKALVPMDEAIPKLALIQRANSNGFGLNNAKRLLADLIADGELHEWRVARKGTNPEIRIARREQVLI